MFMPGMSLMFNPGMPAIVGIEDTVGAAVFDGAFVSVDTN